MTDVKRCNNPECGKIGEDPWTGWLYVSRESIWPQVGEEPGPWDFCSYSCVAVWSATQMKRGHRRGPPPPDTLT